MEKVRERGSGGPERRVSGWSRGALRQPSRLPQPRPAPRGRPRLVSSPAPAPVPRAGSVPARLLRCPAGFSPCPVNLGRCGCVLRQGGQNPAWGRGSASGRCVFPLPGTTHADLSLCWSPSPTSSHCRAASLSLAPNTEPITVAVCPLH